jgi:hypothetical protein
MIVVAAAVFVFVLALSLRHMLHVFIFFGAIICLAILNYN